MVWASASLTAVITLQKDRVCTKFFVMGWTDIENSLQPDDVMHHVHLTCLGVEHSEAVPWLIGCIHHKHAVHPLIY